MFFLLHFVECQDQIYDEVDLFILNLKFSFNLAPKVLLSNDALWHYFHSNFYIYF